MNRQRMGFTLLELLVVVMIIGILIALTMPSIGRARAQSRRVACQQTLHGLAIAFRTYLDEFSNTMPVAAQKPSVNSFDAFGNGLPDGVPPLPLVMEAQVSSPKGWFCPGDNKGYTRSSDGKSFDSYFEGETLSYEYNMTLNGLKVERYFLFPLVGEYGTPILFDFDAFHDDANAGKTYSMDTGGGQKVSGSKLSHNILFSDGHIGTIDDLRPFAK